MRHTIPRRSAKRAAHRSQAYNLQLLSALARFRGWGRWAGPSYL